MYHFNRKFKKVFSLNAATHEFNLILKNMKKNGNAEPITMFSSNTSLTITSVNYNLIHVNLSSITKMIDLAGYSFLNLSISNDNINFTSPLRMTAYNSRLYICDSSKQSCTRLVR